MPGPFHPQALASAVALVRCVVSAEAGTAFEGFANGFEGADAAFVDCGIGDAVLGTVLPSLDQADLDERFASVFDVHLYRRFVEDRRPRCSPGLARLLIGSFPLHAGGGSAPPDAAAAEWVAVIAAAAASGCGHHLIHQCEGPTPRERSTATNRLADLLTAAGVQNVVAEATSASILAAVLRCELHAGAVPCVVLLDADVTEAQPSATEDHDGFVSSQVVTGRLFERDVPLLPAMRNTYVWRLFDGLAPPPALLRLAGGVFGPLGVDRGWREATLAEMAPELGAAARQAVLGRHGDPREARPLLGLAAAVAVKGTLDLDAAVAMLARSLDSSRRTASVAMPPAVPPHRYDPLLFVGDPHGADELLAPAALEGLRRTGAKVLLHGPSGGGKSAFCVEAARRLGMALMERRGSQLWTPKLGESERLVARACAEAVTTGAILWFDECDSLMLKRGDVADAANVAGNSYLIRTMTNEFLKALETHPSMIFAACNDVAVVDLAVRRRFDLVIAVAASLPPSREARAYESVLDTSVPQGFRPIGATCVADYAAAGRRCRLLGREGFDALAEAVLRARDERLGRPPRRDPGPIRSGGTH